MKYHRTKTIIVWKRGDGTYYSKDIDITWVRSPIDATDYTQYHHEAIQDLQESMTCNPPSVVGNWTKIKIQITATTLLPNEH